MFEMIEKDRRKGWRKFLPFQRRRRVLMPPVVHRKKRDDEEEERKKTQEDERTVHDVQKEASEQASRMKSSQTADKAQTGGSDDGEEKNGVRLKTVGPEINIDGITAPRVLDVLGLYQARRNRGLSESSESLKQLYQDISAALSDTAAPVPADEADRIRMELLAPLSEEIANREVQEHLEEPKRQRSMYESQEMYGPQTGPLNEIYIDDPTGPEGSKREARKSDMLADRKFRDYVFDKLFALADAQPDQQFQAAFDQIYDQAKYKSFLKVFELALQSDAYLSQESLDKFRTLKGIGDGVPVDEVKTRMREEIKSDFERYKLERKIREIVHNANYVLDVPNIKAEQIYDFIDGFSSEHIDYVWRMPGVRDMMNIYEMQLRQAMWEKDGYLDPEDVKRFVRKEIDGDHAYTKVVTPIVEERTKKLFAEQYANRENPAHRSVYVRSDRVNKQEHVLDRKLEPWEIDRIFTTARGMMVLSLRMLSLAAESKIPANGQYTSLFLQDALQTYAPFQHLLWKYHVPNDKSLSVLLTEPDRDKYKIFGDRIRKPWFTKHIEHVKHTLESGSEGARKILDGQMGEFVQLRRQNPGYCGDIFGFLGWRVGSDPKKATGSELFLNIGETRMRNRIADPNSPAGQLYAGLSDEDKEKYVEEYGSWIGTGFRFESLRGDLLDKKKENVDAASQESKLLLKRIVELQPGRIFLKSSKIQHRLKPALDHLAEELGYVSGQRGYDDVYHTTPSSEMMQKVHENLTFLESQMYKRREQILDMGKTFDGRIENTEFDLQFVKGLVDADGISLPHAEERDWHATEEFIRLMQEDFAANAEARGSWTRDHHGHKEYLTDNEGYYREFIDAREYNHGFTLWSGDAPVDEFNMAATGPTGGFIRRARENKDIGEANMLIIQFLSDTKYIRTPDQAYEHLTKIYGKIKDYDATMAKETVTYLAEGIMKFYGATGLAKIPVIGGIVKTYPDALRDLVTFPGKIPVLNKLVNKLVQKSYNLPGIGEYLQDGSTYITGSLAQRFYGKRAPVWHASETKYFIDNLLFEHGYIYPHQKKLLENRLSAHAYDAFADVTSMIAPLLALAILFYILKESAEDV